MTDGGPSAQRDVTSRIERRRWARLALWIPVFVRGTDQQGRRFLEFANALDINPGGMLLAIRRYVPPGNELSLEVPSAPMPVNFGRHPAVKVLHGDVLRVEHAGDVFVTAVAFSSMPLGAAPSSP